MTEAFGAKPTLGAIDLAEEPPFALGPLAIRPQALEVEADGKVLRLEPRVMQVLIALARADGAVVTRDELIRTCWGGVVVGEDAITRAMVRLRKFGERDGSLAFKLDTIPKVGYRLTSVPQSPCDAAAPRTAICVLPFLNLSGDPGQDYFSDGVTEDIITELAHWTELAVASRSASFRHKGRPVDSKRVAQELGVGFLVEGSLRRMGDRTRITVQLTDATTGRQVWGGRFDRVNADLFDVQDEVVRTIVGTLVGRVYESETDRLRRKPPVSFDAYDLTLRGNALSWDDPKTAGEAKRMFVGAIELDPNYAKPHTLMAAALAREWTNDLASSNTVLDRALAFAERGVALAGSESTAYIIRALLHVARRDFDHALYDVEHGVALNPANQWNQADYGCMLARLGRAEEGLQRLEEARRADPYFDPPWYWRDLGIAKFVLRRYRDALTDFDRVGAYKPPYLLAVMAGCCAKLGLASRASELVAQCLAQAPTASIEAVLSRLPFMRPEDTDHLRECLRLAGLGSKA